MTVATNNIGKMILDFISEKRVTEKVASFTDVNEAKKISEGLAKVASYPCNEQVYGSVQEMMKIASKCIGSLLQALQTSNARTSEIEKGAEVKCLLEDMVSSGLVSNTELEEKVAELMKKDSQNLSILKEAVKLAGSKESESLIFEQGSGADVSRSRGNKRGMFDGVL